MAREGYKPLFEDWLPYMAVGAAGLRQYSAAALRLRSGTAVGELIEPRPGPDGTTAEAASPWRLQKTLLRIMSQLDDTCVIHRAGYERAQEVKEEARALLEQLEGLEQLEEQKQLEGHEQLDSSGSITSLKQMKERYDAEGISPGGAADMLALTVLVDSLLR